MLKLRLFVVLLPLLMAVQAVRAEAVNTGSCTPSTNLIAGNAFESASDLDDWTPVGGFAGYLLIAGYSTGWAGTAPVGAGSSFLYGKGGHVTVEQTLDISDCITAGKTDYDFSTLLGGYGDNDTIQVKLAFKQADNTVVASYDTGVVTSNKSMSPFTKSATIQSTVTKVTVTLLFKNSDGAISSSDTDGYVDNISLKLSGNNNQEDDVPPVITLTGAEEVILNVGESYVEQGATATDNVDGIVNVVVTGSVDTSAAGTYTITYTAIDVARNSASVTRRVIVMPLTTVDITPPVITLTGAEEVVLNVGDSYVEQGATATDNIDGIVNVAITGSVDTSAAGTYTITYTAIDVASNSASVTRRVIVITDTIGLCTPNINLIAGNTFESTADLDNWTTTGGFAGSLLIAGYSTGWAGTAPVGAGSSFLYGKGGHVTVEQTLDISDCITAGKTDYDFSTLLGGYGDNDTIQVKLAFKQADNTVVASYDTGVVTSNKLMSPFTKSDTIPSTVTKVTITLLFKNSDGAISSSDTDGYVDNISLKLSGNNNREDDVPPVITLTGAEEVILNVGDSYVEQGATATDNIDGIVNVAVTGSVNTSAAGTYTITYTAIDVANNSASTTRNIIVMPLTTVDITPPVITLTGGEVILSVGESYVEQGATATDNVDGIVNVAITGSVDTSAAGTYTITYTAIDLASNSASVTRRVIVITDTIGLCTPNINLIAGNTFESTADLDNWTTTGGFAGSLLIAGYSTGWAGTAPVGAGSSFLYGKGGHVTVEQTLDISDCITAGKTDYDFSTLLGGYGDNDTIQVKLAFKQADNTVVASYDTGVVTSNKLMSPFTKSDTIPSTVTKVTVTLLFKNSDGAISSSDTDGYVDNISLKLTTVIPEMIYVDIEGGTILEADSGVNHAVFNVKLSHRTNTDITMDYTTVPGTALEGDDYTGVSGSLTISAGSLNKTVSVNIVGDTDVELDEGFSLTISNLEGAEAGTLQANFNIRNDDGVAYGLDPRPASSECVAGDRPSLDSGELSLSIENAFSGIIFNKPVAMVQAPDDDSRFFVVEVGGVVKVIHDGVLQTTPFLDISDNRGSRDSDGLYSLAFHPDYVNNGFFYVSYVDANSWSQVSRFKVSSNPNVADDNSEFRILERAQPSPYHNNSHVEFDADGYLYIAMGDGGSDDSVGDSDNYAQDTSTWLGSILRVDVDGGSPYTIPEDNPFAGQSCNQTARTGNCPEIYAWGFRSPWRMSIDSQTQDFWLGDVGQNTVEEINIIEKGKNYGWRCLEGNDPYNSSGCTGTSFTDPILTYRHEGGACSVTGGYIYRGDNIPALKGTYLYGDLCTGDVHGLPYYTQPGVASSVLFNTASYLVSFAEDNSGELYTISYYSGSINKIISTGGSGVVNSNVPNLLSESACVASENPAMPSSSMIPFKVNAPHWADGAHTENWLVLPTGGKIDHQQGHDWIFPIGSVIMKNFILNESLIETRFMMRHNDGAWGGYTYEWNDAGTNANLVIGGKEKEIDGQTWIYPSAAECSACHTEAAGGVLAPETGQLNGLFTYPRSGVIANQLESIEKIGLFSEILPASPDGLVRLVNPYDSTKNLQDRAKSWLHTNCSSCHQPGVITEIDIDFRYTTPLSDMKLCNVPPQNSSWGLNNPMRLAPSDVGRSLIHNRSGRLDAGQMPPIGTNTLDTQGLELIEQWINSMSSCP